MQLTDDPLALQQALIGLISATAPTAAGARMFRRLLATAVAEIGEGAAMAESGVKAALAGLVEHLTCATEHAEFLAAHHAIMRQHPWPAPQAVPADAAGRSGPR